MEQIKKHVLSSKAIFQMKWASQLFSTNTQKLFKFIFYIPLRNCKKNTFLVWKNVYLKTVGLSWTTLSISIFAHCFSLDRANNKKYQGWAKTFHVEFNMWFLRERLSNHVYSKVIPEWVAIRRNLCEFRFQFLDTASDPNSTANINS